MGTIHLSDGQPRRDSLVHSTAWILRLGKSVFYSDSRLLPNKDQVRARFDYSFEHLEQKPEINIVYGSVGLIVVGSF